METKNVHLLLVEDNQNYLEELIELLKEDFGYQNIETAVSAKEATEKLQNPFDIIVADMRMEADDSGFAVLEEVQSRNLSSFVIILTANDSVTDCRDAFKKGAWDYISKNMKGDVFEILDKSIKEAITDFNSWGNVKNDRWIEKNREHLEDQYWGKYIAVINQTVIEVADTEEELNQKIEERKLRRFLTTIRKIDEFKPIDELIKQGESDSLEFKSTLRWDIEKYHKNEKLKFNVLKTIVVFLNSQGGTLLIGVEENGNIFGLEKDISFLETLDKFKQTLSNFIYDRIRAGFPQYIKVRIETLETKEICIVDVKRSLKKSFLKTEKGLEFYIRVGNTSRGLTIPEIHDHFS
ncbi:MAG: response regulator [Okeania sp. SIO2G4]|uniref:RNA-binding domain-containing protein n=1 Tax=unclassified Okeania TaxID=2634635 RepID=UPI0013BA3177|nr:MULTISPECIES: RNA-binding domain-containing protein [unclassified Okeania]NEP39352.1 response regulator [Okeania sp. SIO2H7]NEP71115.1 response regulator [Okeania sp. SIO2G5]NEP92029.1 response regulator [Okeania sp. SIO2F5]NEQ90144.1 response regulator [Okeania sp. SIO2G4]